MIIDRCSQVHQICMMNHDQMASSKSRHGPETAKLLSRAQPLLGADSTRNHQRGRNMSELRTTTLPILIVTAFLLVTVGQTQAQAEKSRILVAYYSKTGHTAAMAKAVAEGSKKIPTADVTVKTVSEIKCADLFAADALVVGSPVYWSNMAGEVKIFFDRWSNECHVLPPDFQMKDKVGAAFVTAGEVSSGKETTLLSIVAAMLGNRMIVISEGQALGATATTGEGKTPLNNKDLEEARRLGERVARVTATLKLGRSQGK